MIRRALAIALATGSTATAAPPKPVIEQVSATARAAGFDGALLIGEADGSFRTLTFGADPVQPSAVWRWASITKQLAAVIAMQEVARGKLDPETTVAMYWPDWKAPYAGRIRIRELLNHQSGLPQPDESPADKDGVPAFYGSAASAPSASAAGFCAGPARAAPPAKFNYNNCDTIVLAEVLARITGTPFEQLVRDRIARPLGLKSFGFYGLGARPKHVASTGEYSGIDTLINLGVGGTSSSAYGTIADLWTFDRALLDGRLLDAAARERMWTASVDNGF